jgi:signal transduction histidine kinase
MMHEADFTPDDGFKNLQRENRDTTNMYLKARLAEQSDRQHLLDLLNQGLIPKLIGLHIKMDATKYPEYLSSDINQMKALIDAAIENTHILTDEIAPHVLLSIGLRAALRELCENVSHDFDIRYYINIQNSELNFMDDSINLLIFNIVKKLVNGIVRSCSADIIGINLQKSGPFIEVIIQDNGSFTGDIDEIVTAGQSREYAFFVEAAEQVCSMGGKFWIDKAAGMRTVYTSIPFKIIDIQ